MPPKLLTDLPADVVQHILVRLTLAHNIGRAAPTCKVVSVAAGNAIKVRRFSSEVVTLAGHTGLVRCVAHPDDWVMALVALPDNQHALSASNDSTVKLFNVNDGAVLRTFTHHTDQVYCLALLPDGLRFVSGSYDNTARIAYHGLAP